LREKEKETEGRMLTDRQTERKTESHRVKERERERERARWLINLTFSGVKYKEQRHI